MLPCPPDRLVADLARPEPLDRVAAPMLVVDPVRPAEWQSCWTETPHSFRLLLGGWPIGAHVIDVQKSVADPAGSFG